MKLWRLGVLALLLLMLCNLMAVAQKKAKPQANVSTPKYVCLLCKVGAEKEGKCPICNLQMGKAGVNVCLGCGAMSDKPGECTTCKRAMVNLASLAKQCKTCRYFTDKNKKECLVCEHRKKAKGNPAK